MKTNLLNPKDKNYVRFYRQTEEAFIMGAEARIIGGKTIPERFLHKSLFHTTPRPLN